MVTHLSYTEEQYANATECIAGIRSYIERGWEVLQLRGPRRGPFLVVFRIQEDTQ